MSYRSGYYKKDGTYVQGHYVNSKTHLKQSNNKKNIGCFSIFLLMLIFITAISSNLN